MNLNMYLQSQVLKAFKAISENEGIEIKDPTVVLIDKDPTQSIGIDFETGIFEFNPKCLKQPMTPNFDSVKYLG
jgi:hypothetical protein